MPAPLPCRRSGRARRWTGVLAAAAVASAVALSGCDGANAGPSAPVTTGAAGATPSATVNLPPGKSSDAGSSTSATPPVPTPASPSPTSPAPPATPSPSPSVDHGPALESASWGEREGGRSLAVVPASWVRAATDLGAVGTLWAEIVAAHPDADSPGMYDQLVCHAIGAPDKDSWNLEPWRPDVGLVAVMQARCNPR